METLFAPWRYKYVSRSDGEGECVFCKIINSDKDRDNLVLTRARKNIVVLNRYPYTSGHLMVAPLRHVADPCEASQDELSEMMRLCTAAVAALRGQYDPDRFR